MLAGGGRPEVDGKGRVEGEERSRCMEEDGVEGAMHLGDGGKGGRGGEVSVKENGR